MSGTGQEDLRDQRIGSFDPGVIIVTKETRTHWVYSMWDTQSWEGTEYEAEEADSYIIPEAGRSVAV